MLKKNSWGVNSPTPSYLNTEFPKKIIPIDGDKLESGREGNKNLAIFYQQVAVSQKVRDKANINDDH